MEKWIEITGVRVGVGHRLPPLRSFRWDGFRAATTAARDGLYYELIAMRLTPARGFSDFGSEILRTPFLDDASTLSSATSSSAICRWNEP
jgi:hypothetical protein